MPPKILSATGHRPHRLGPDGFSSETNRKLHRLASESLAVIRPDMAIVGMALGWDLAVAHAALDLGIPVLAAIPYNGQESRWPAESQRRYHAILKRCFQWEVVNPGPYAGWKLHARNVFMADLCDVLLTLWDGSPEGGTANCVRYAETLRPIPEIVHLWPRWLDLR